MKYEISCASGQEPPCDKAYTEEEGEYPTWYIDINTLTELQELVNKEDSIILYPTKIVIYDSYVE